MAHRLTNHNKTNLATKFSSAARTRTSLGQRACTPPARRDRPVSLDALQSARQQQHRSRAEGCWLGSGSCTLMRSRTTFRFPGRSTLHTPVHRHLCCQSKQNATWEAAPQKAPPTSWMWPNTCTFGRIRFLISLARSGQPTRPPNSVQSPNRYGGPCVISTSVPIPTHAWLCYFARPSSNNMATDSRLTCVVRNSLPLFLQPCTNRQVERPVTELRLPRAPVELES